MRSVAGSNPAYRVLKDMAQRSTASGLGPEYRGFESHYPY